MWKIHIENMKNVCYSIKEVSNRLQNKKERLKIRGYKSHGEERRNHDLRTYSCAGEYGCLF